MAISVSAQYHFDSWTTQNGLPYNRINGILQTHDGYLWFATADGLVRYDGIRFTVFNAGNSPGLKSNRCVALYEDAEGTLWIGTEDSGLVRYRNGIFTTFSTDQGLPYNFVRKIWADGYGRMVLALTDRIYLWQDGKVTEYPLPTKPQPFYINSSQQNGHVWYCDNSALHIFSGDRTVNLTLADGLSTININAVYEDHLGNVWIGTNTGLNLLKDGKITVLTTKNGLPEDRITAIVEDELGNLWLAAGSSGVVLYKDGRFTNFTSAQGLSDNSAFKLYVDRENTLWVGTNGHGLNKSSRDTIRMLTEQTGLPSNNTYPIFQDHDGTIWFGTWPKGLTRYRDGQFVSEIGRFLSPNFSALAEERGGALWMGFYNGIARSENGQIKNLTATLGNDVHYVSAILQDREGNVWCGSSKGLFKYRDDTFTLYTTKDGLAGTDVRAIIEDRKGVLWFGSYGGLTSFASGRWQTFTKKDGLSGDRIRTLYEDKEGVLWVGTYDGGISRIKDGKITGITQKDGLHSDGSFQIIEDDRGFFWVSCNTGIYRVSKKDLNDFADGKLKSVFSVAYGKSDGMSDIECNGGTQPAGIKTRDGQLWFPTQGGVAVIDPREIPFNPLPPPVMIENCLLETSAASCQDLKINPGQQNLEIHYTALSFIKPEQVRFKYKLIGLDNEWIEVGTRRTAYFSHLPPGDYTFSVIAANSDGVWSKEGPGIHITVVPPFWRTWWFLSLSILAVGAIVALAYRQRVVQLERRSALQTAFSRQLIESQENERMRIATELHDGLGQNLLVIKNRALFGMAEPENGELAQKQLGEISGMASQAISEVRAIARNLRPYQLDRLGLTLAIESIITGVSTSSNLAITSEIDSIDNVLSSEGEINLYRIIQEAVNNIIKHSGATKATVMVKRVGNAIDVTIQDNGKGFDAQSPAAGLGLLSISERARILGGRIEIESTPGAGSTINLKFNLTEVRSNGNNTQA